MTEEHVSAQLFLQNVIDKFQAAKQPLWIQSPVKEKNTDEGNYFLPVWKMQRFLLFYFLLRSWQRCSGREANSGQSERA